MLNRIFGLAKNRRPYSRIAFDRTGETVPGCPRGIYTIDPDGADPRRIRDNGESPRWSPDGRSICFVENTPDNGWLPSVFVMQPDGQQARRVTFHHDVSVTPAAWSPDSRRLTYSLWLWEEKVYQLRVLDLRTGDSRPLLYSEDAIYPMWAPSNKIVFNQHGAPSGTRLFEVDSADPRPRPSTLFESGDIEPVWNYDGSKVVVGRGDGIVVMNADGSEPLVIHCERQPTQWAISPDRQHVAYTCQESHRAGFEVFVIGLGDKTKIKLVANPIVKDKEVDSRYVSWSPWLS
jgi:dipeptidyl aminopeptidase/acylaminoacyl peptidase